MSNTEYNQILIDEIDGYLALTNSALFDLGLDRENLESDRLHLQQQLKEV